MGDMTVGSAAVLLADADRGLIPTAGLAALSEQEASVAAWALEHARPAGQGTDTLPGAQVYVAPLVATDRANGVLTVQRRPGARPLDVEQRHLIDVFARQTALTIDRLALGDRAREADARARSEELRATLLSSVSHDLRTPLTAITGAAAALRSHGDVLPAAERTALLDSIGDEAARLGRILNNVLDLTRLEAGAAVRRQWVALEEVVGSVLGRLERELADREVAVELPEDLPLVHADPVLLDQLLSNLVENALRYTPTGSPIEIAARVGPDQVALEVRDRGPGLPHGGEGRIFEKFWRADPTDRRGAGLGLAIAQAVATAHGGALAANNREGGGARFVLTLPHREDAPAVPGEEAVVA
jgi:two-component system sensor histidine kinase KdpD